jgi:hypothetical protein
MAAPKKIPKKPTVKNTKKVTKKPNSLKREVVAAKKKIPRKVSSGLVRADLVKEMVDIEHEHIHTDRTHHIIETLLLSIVILLVLILVSLVWFLGNGIGMQASIVEQNPIQHFSVKNIKSSDVVPMQSTIVAGHTVNIPAHWGIDSEFYSQKNEDGDMVVSAAHRYVPSTVRDPMRDFIIHGGNASDCDPLTQYGLCVERYELATGSSDPQVLAVFANMVSQLKVLDGGV